MNKQELASKIWQSVKSKYINKILIILLSLFILFACDEKEKTKTNQSVDNKNKITDRSGVQDFDLSFLKLENKQENIVYSPLSIKYCLALLKEGASGNSKRQLESIMGTYEPKVYTNSENLSLANIVVVRDTLKDAVNNEFKDTIKDKYSAEFRLDSFSDPKYLNDWISDNTFGMVNNFIDSFNPDLNFLIINALAIDMEWINKLQNLFMYRSIHEKYEVNIEMYSSPEESSPLEFDESMVNSVEFIAIANKYDIIKELGEDNIREIVSNDLREHLNSDSYVYEYMSSAYNTNNIETIISNYLDEYIENISKNYGYYDESTDFYYYINDHIKVFAKDLKEYNNTQFQFVAIMPINEGLSSYVQKVNSKKINTIITNLKKPSFDEFEEGYITEIKGSFPTFSFKYELNLNRDLIKLGLSDMFELNNDFNKIVGDEPVYITTKHTSTFDLSNDGIKASAVTMAAGGGATADYDYLFDVPIKTIDLEFNKPFLFLVRNKDTNDIWFVGTLYKGDKVNNIKICVIADAVKIRENPSIDSKQIGLAKKYDELDGTGNVKNADGYTWYELKDGGWIADKNKEWLKVIKNN